MISKNIKIVILVLAFLALTVLSHPFDKENKKNSIDDITLKKPLPIQAEINIDLPEDKTTSKAKKGKKEKEIPMMK